MISFPKPTKKLKTKSPIKRVSKRSLPRAKKRAWDAFSIYIRTRNADSNGFTACFTCGAVKHYKEMDAGHFYHGTLDFNEYNVNVQCTKCNKYLHGNGVVYYPKMLQMYGQEIIDQLNELRHQVIKLKVADYENIELLYKNKAKELESRKI